MSVCRFNLCCNMRDDSRGYNAINVQPLFIEKKNNDEQLMLIIQRVIDRAFTSQPAEEPIVAQGFSVCLHVLHCIQLPVILK